MRSTPAHTRALVVGYYLSKYDRAGYDRLGLGSVTETHREAGRRLGVPANTVKNMRDEFDPLHDNPRVGWYQRKMPPSRVAVVRRFGDLDEPTLRRLVQDLLWSENAEAEGVEELLQRLDDSETLTPGEVAYRSTRQRTGRLAEEAFERYHRETGRPVSGRLRDFRDQERGYDYLIEGEEDEVYAVEVKGVTDSSSGVLFTDREWRSAQEYGAHYVLVVITSPERAPEVQVIVNPAATLQSNRVYELAVRVNHRVSPAALRVVAVSSPL